MTLLISLAFGAGVAAFVYNKFARRVGYSNTKSVFTIISVVFILSSIVFFTVISTVSSR